MRELFYSVNSFEEIFNRVKGLVHPKMKMLSLITYPMLFQTRKSFVRLRNTIFSRTTWIRLLCLFTLWFELKQHIHVVRLTQNSVRYLRPADILQNGGDATESQRRRIVFILNFLHCVPKTNKDCTGLERHWGKWLMTIFILGWSNPLS